MLKYCPLESLKKMEGSRERGLIESIKKRQSLLSSFLRTLHSSEQGHTPAWTQPAQNKTKGISVHSSTKHTSVSTTGFQISDLESEGSCCIFYEETPVQVLWDSCIHVQQRLQLDYLHQCWLPVAIWFDGRIKRRFNKLQLSSPQNIH